MYYLPSLGVPNNTTVPDAFPFSNNAFIAIALATPVTILRIRKYWPKEREKKIAGLDDN